ncbi:Succinate--hydroxymethylglutarate CoA-transferase [Dissostichus eleginoides]|uniref:Succinate--hydroxymethylglutarate CoA-transferase n=1 Tax=Dissostichus eleginoides TaxID=100907 RepID=A0AAD9EVH5_DISEL|nr:Succinate--hydroxymethylglutarate CoA-transferase [Dissostichus eleginoides]
MSKKTSKKQDKDDQKTSKTKIKTTKKTSKKQDKDDQKMSKKQIKTTIKTSKNQDKDVQKRPKTKIKPSKTKIKTSKNQDKYVQKDVQKADKDDQKDVQKQDKDDQKDVKHNGLIQEMKHPTAGTSLSFPPSEATPPPLIGQHTVQVLRDTLSYTDDVIESLLESRAVAQNEVS